MKDLTQEFLKLHVIAMAVEILDKVRQQLARALQHGPVACPALVTGQPYTLPGNADYISAMLCIWPGACMTMLAGPCMSIIG